MTSFLNNCNFIHCIVIKKLANRSRGWLNAHKTNSSTWLWSVERPEEGLRK